MNGYARGIVEKHKPCHNVNRQFEVNERLPENCDWFVTAGMRPFITLTHQIGYSGKFGMESKITALITFDNSSR